jgi:predicted transposase/invertase (TIGR01784 family)
MDAFIYLLIEHKSWEELFTGFQLLKYMVRIWELYLRQNNNAKTLPVIIPVVIYHGPKKWRIDTHFISLFDVPDYVKDYIPDFNYNLHDISHYHDEEIKGVVLLRILFKTLKYISTPALRHKLREILQLFRELEDKRKGTEYLEVLLRYIASSARSLSEEELKESVSQIFEEGGDFMATIAEKWTQEVKWDVVRNSLKEGLPINTIVRITGLPAEEINRMKEEMAKSKSSQASQTQL